MSVTSQPLRTALIGLSSTAATSWAANAHLPGLLTSTGRSKITITALLNSNVDAARLAIQKYKLPAETKAYGSPEDLAADADIDLVICNTRVDKHYETILPSVRAGKDVFVEWPIAAKREHIDELVKTANNSGSRIAVGLQRRFAPPVLKLKEVVSGGNGKLGKVLSAEVRAFGNTVDREILPVTLKYFAQREIGGNPIVIGVGHLLDYVLSVVGDLDPSSVQVKTQLQRPNIRVRDPSTNQIIEEITSDVPDLLSFHGAVAASSQAVPNATLSFSFRRGQPFPGTPSLTFSINCEFGEIRLVSPAGLSLEAGPRDEPVTIQVHHFADNKVENVAWSWNDRQEELPIPARNVSESLYAFADGRGEGDGWVSIEDAARRADLIRKFFEQ